MSRRAISAAYVLLTVFLTYQIYRLSAENHALRHDAAVLDRGLWASAHIDEAYSKLCVYKSDPTTYTVDLAWQRPLDREHDWHGAAADQDGKRAAVASVSTVRIFEKGGGSESHAFRGYVEAVGFSNEGILFALVADAGIHTIYREDGGTFTEVKNVQVAPQEEVKSLSWVNNLVTGEEEVWVRKESTGIVQLR